MIHHAYIRNNSSLDGIKLCDPIMNVKGCQYNDEFVLLKKNTEALRINAAEEFGKVSGSKLGMNKTVGLGNIPTTTQNKIWK